MIFDEELESLCESRFCSMIFGQGGHHLMMFNDESGIKALGFKESANEFIEHSDGGPGIGTVNFMFFTLLIEENFSFFAIKILRNRNSQLFFKTFNH